MPRPLQNLETWSGCQVLLDERRWLLRSGEVVQILLAPNEPADGFYVPMRAVCKERGQTFIHVVNGAASQATARRIFVEFIEGASVLGETAWLRIHSKSREALREGMQVIVEGTHYLNDGDRVVASPLVGGQS